jgi:hypothetical protein
MTSERATGPCSVCAYAASHGWWGPNHRGTHCRMCHRSWTAKRAAHCPVCCEHFATDATAQLHWAGGSYGARHLDPRAVPSLVQDCDGVWHMAGSRPASIEQLCAGPQPTRPVAPRRPFGTPCPLTPCMRPLEKVARSVL